MDSTKFNKLSRELQAAAKKELIDYLKSISDGSCIELPEEADAMECGIDCNDWDEEEVFVTGIRLNDAGELEFKAEYCDSDDEYGTDGWDTLFDGNTKKLEVGMESLYAFAIDTVARNSRGFIDETFTVNILSEVLHNTCKPEDSALFGTKEVCYAIKSAEVKEDGYIFLNAISEGEGLTVVALEQELNDIEGDRLVFVYDEEQEIRYRIENCFTTSKKGKIYSLIPED